MKQYTSKELEAMDVEELYTYFEKLHKENPKTY